MIGGGSRKETFEGERETQKSIFAEGSVGDLRYLKKESKLEVSEKLGG